MNRTFCKFLYISIALMALASCSSKEHASKVTTTTNGFAFIDSHGKAIPAARVILAQDYDTLQGIPLGADTLIADSAGYLELPLANYRFIWAFEENGSLGLSRVLNPNQGVDTLILGLRSRRILGQLVAPIGFEGGAPLLVPCLCVPHYNENLGWFVDDVSAGEYQIFWRSELDSSLVAMQFLTLDTLPTGDENRLWFDDFEDASIDGLISGSRWWGYSRIDSLQELVDSASLVQMMHWDSLRQSVVFHTTYKAPIADYISYQLKSIPKDLSTYSEFCLSYRSDRRMKLEWFGDSIDNVSDPNFWIYIDASKAWKDTCIPFASLIANTNNPDSRLTWEQFRSSLLHVQVLATSGASYFGLDDMWAQ